METNQCHNVLNFKRHRILNIENVPSEKIRPPKIGAYQIRAQNFPSEKIRAKKNPAYQIRP